MEFMLLPLLAAGYIAWLKNGRRWGAIEMMFCGAACVALILYWATESYAVMDSSPQAQMSANIIIHYLYNTAMIAMMPLMVVTNILFFRVSWIPGTILLIFLLPVVVVIVGSLLYLDKLM